MLAASHALIGGSLAQIFKNPLIGLPLALVSHFICDLIPHWDFQIRIKKLNSLFKLIIISLTDSFFGLILGFLIFSPNTPTIYLIIMMFTAQLPDWLEAPYHVFAWNFPPFSTIKKLQSKIHTKAPLPYGLITQILTVSLLMLTAFLI